MDGLHGSTIEVRRRKPADDLLLNGNAADGVDDFEAELVDQTIVLAQHLSLEETKALERIGAPAEVHTGFVELQLDTPSHETVERDVDRDSKIQCQIRLDRKTVELPHPLPIDPSSGVAGKRCVSVSIRQHNHAGFERRDDLVEEPISEVRGVQQ